MLGHDANETGIWIYYIIQFFQRLRYATPLLSMAYMSPLVVAGIIAALTTGMVLSRIGPAWVMVISMLAFLTGSIITATMPVDQSYWAQSFVATLIIPFGMDMSFPAGNLIMSNAVKKEHQGMAASLVNTVINNNGGLTHADELVGYRNALHLAIGLSALGVFTSLRFLLKVYLRDRRTQPAQNQEK